MTKKAINEELLTDDEDGADIVYLDEKGNEIGADGNIEEDDDDDLLTQEEIYRGGAYITTPGGTKYWLNIERLKEFTRMDKAIAGEADFWAWFDAAVTTWGLKGERGLRGRIDDLKGKWGWAPPKPKYLSDYWGGSTWFGSVGGSKNTEDARKLAVALQAVQSTIRVVDSHEKRMIVRLAQDEAAGAPESYTEFGNRIIQVSPMALTDPAVEQGEGIDITTGFALHEASHAQYSEPTLQAMRQPTVLLPLAVVGLLHNILEDVRIEEMTSEVFPGFAGYFDKSHDYVWDLQKKVVPTKWGPSLKEKLGAIIAGVKWPAHYQPIVDKDAVLLTEIPWWQAWVKRYHDEVRATNTPAVPMRKCLTEALERLAEDPNTKKEMDAQAARDKVRMGTTAPTGEQLAAMIDEAIKRGGFDKMGACSSTGGTGAPNTGGVVDPTGKRKPGIGGTLGQEVTRLVESEIEAGEITDYNFPHVHNCKPKVTILHPPESQASRDAYKLPPFSVVQKMKSAFFFRPSAREWASRLLRSGALDEDELWRAGGGDYRVFQQKTTESTPDTTVTLLVDLSGSMFDYAGGGARKTKVDVAIELAHIMQACLKDMPGVRVRVRGHTGDTGDGGSRPSTVLYRLWEKGEALTRLSIAKTIHAGNNYDGYAIGLCVQEMLDEVRPEEQLVLIVLSDGHPAGSGYGGEPAYKHVRDIVEWAARKGVEVVQVAIDPAMDPQRQAKMFRNWVPFQGVEKLPAQMTTLLRRVFPGR